MTHKSLTRTAQALGLLFILFLALRPIPAEAQGTLLTPHVESSLSLEYSKPFFDPRRPSTTAGSSVWFLSTRIVKNDQIYVIAELPLVFAQQRFTTTYSNFGVKSVYRATNQTMIGNPLIGVEVTPESLPVYYMLGVRLPLADNDLDVAEAYGMAGDFDRFDAFSRTFTSIRTRVGLMREFRSNTKYHFWLGSILQIGNRLNSRKPLYFDYGVQLRSLNRTYRIILSISGIMLYSGRTPEFTNRLAHQFGATVNFGSGWIRPGIHFRSPLSEQLGIEHMNYVVGFDLTMRIGPAY